MELNELTDNNIKIGRIRGNIRKLKRQNAKKLFKMIDFFDDNRKDFGLRNRYFSWNKIGDELQYKEKLISNFRTFILKYKGQEVYKGMAKRIIFVELDNDTWLVELVSQYYRHFNQLTKELEKLESYQKQINDSLSVEGMLS